MGKNYVEFKYGKGLVVLDVLDIKKYIPSDIWWEGIKRGKGFKRTNESYERKGNPSKQDPRITERINSVGILNAVDGSTGIKWGCPNCGENFYSTVSMRDFHLGKCRGENQ